jgi:hypothetical protein
MSEDQDDEPTRRDIASYLGFGTLAFMSGTLVRAYATGEQFRPAEVTAGRVDVDGAARGVVFRVARWHDSDRVTIAVEGEVRETLRRSADGPGADMIAVEVPEGARAIAWTPQGPPREDRIVVAVDEPGPVS